MKKYRHFLVFMIGLSAALSFSATLKILKSPFSKVLTPSFTVMAAPLGDPGIQDEEMEGEANNTGYTISWFTIDGGGGAGSGGSYDLKYTIGQPEANLPTAGAFKLQGGFWPGIFENWFSLLPVIGK